MKKPSFHDEMTIRHQFDRLCQMPLKGEAASYYRYIEYRRRHEAMFAELSVNLVCSTGHKHRTRSLEILKKIMKGKTDEKEM